MHHTLGAVALAAGAALLSAGLLAADEWTAVPVADPLRTASAPLDVAAARTLGAGEWTLEGSLAYFNVAAESWHTGTLHRELGLTGQPLADWELRLLEHRHPADEIYRIDVEGWRADLAVAVGLGRDLTASVRVARVGVGRPHWDAIADSFHEAFGLSGGRRTWFARGQSVVYVRGRHDTVERWQQLEDDVWADTLLSLSGPGGSWLGASHRWVIAVEVPTGPRGSLAGSGGWDLGGRWVATWQRDRRLGRVAVGYTLLDDRGEWLGVPRADTWHLLTEVRLPLSRRVDWQAVARLDSSPLADLTRLDPGSPAFFLGVGAVVATDGPGWVALCLGENYPIRGVAPDFTFHLQFGVRPRGRPR